MRNVLGLLAGVTAAAVLSMLLTMLTNLTTVVLGKTIATILIGALALGLSFVCGREVYRAYKGTAKKSSPKLLSAKR